MYMLILNLMFDSDSSFYCSVNRGNCSRKFGRYGLMLMKPKSKLSLEGFELK